jgi:hypothetical protein
MMYKILEEVKRRFPIGCRYADANYLGIDRGKLKMDSTTYEVMGNLVLAHTGGGVLYNDGKWATLLNENGEEQINKEQHYEIY